MRQATLPIHEIGAIAVTRAMAGAGLGLLVAGSMDTKRRRMVGWPLLAIGLASTVPIVVDIVRRARGEYKGDGH